MTKKDLVKKVAQATGLHANKVESIVEATINQMGEALIRKENLYLRGFGTFLPTLYKAKIGRNIGKGTSLQIPPQYRLKVKLAKSLLKKINK